MFEKLKKTSLGKRLYRITRQPVVGWPVQALGRFVQSEVFQFSHLKPKNRAHNRKQTRTLQRFEKGL